MFNKPFKPDQIEDWACIYQTGVESEAQLVKGFLSDREINCQILSKKDNPFSVNFGDLSEIFLYVPEAEKEKAEEALKEWKEGSLDSESEDLDE
ncbi:DUF2007 domain-containing protein [Balneolaceae bacterium ANBcel3]|nr:DUF2007 domain-containing protein [Balneolaceae bacterium ANBcel3]